MKQPRFYFVTNDLARAALEFYCHPGNLPQWLAVVDNLDDWMKIPAGAKCMGLWYGSAGDVEGWRNAWSTRKERGDLIGITPEELDKIQAWVETARKGPALEILIGVVFDATMASSEDEPGPQLPTPAPAPAAIANQQQTAAKRGQKWT